LKYPITKLQQVAQNVEIGVVLGAVIGNIGLTIR